MGLQGESRDMAGEIVKYDNRLNNISFSGTGITDNLLKLFFTIVCKAKDNGTKDIIITFDEMKKLTKEKSHYTELQYKELVMNLYHVLLNLRIKFDSGEYFGEYNVFAGYNGAINGINDSGPCVVVHVTEPALQLFNSIEKNFTRFELEEFIALPGVYSKHLYRLLKMYRHLGKYTVSMDDLKAYMDIPAGYHTRDITRRVLDPSVEILGKRIPEFSGLKYRYEYYRRRAVKAVFEWTPEKRYRDVKREEQEESLTKELMMTSFYEEMDRIAKEAQEEEDLDRSIRAWGR